MFLMLVMLEYKMDSMGFLRKKYAGFAGGVLPVKVVRFMYAVKDIPSRRFLCAEIALQRRIMKV